MKIDIMEITNLKQTQNKKATRDKVSNDSSEKCGKNFDAVLKEKEKTPVNKEVVEVSKDDKTLNKSNDSKEKQEISDLENVEIDTLLSLLILLNQNSNQENKVYPKIDYENFELNKDIIESLDKKESIKVLEYLVESFESDKPVEKPLISIKELLIDTDESVELSGLKDFLGNIEEKIKNIDINTTSITKNSNLSNLSNKDILNNIKIELIKVLNDKGISDEEIKVFSSKIEAFDFKGMNTSKEDIPKIEILKESSNILDKVEVVNKNTNNFSQDSNEFEGGKESSEDKVLSKILATDENKTSFDINIQRLREFSPIDNKNDVITVNKSSIDLDIKNVVKNMSINNNKELIVKVNPGNLGEIAIKLISEGEQMKAIIKVSSKETFALINSNEIKGLLSNESIKISDVDISLYEDTTFFEEQSRFKQDEEKNKYKANLQDEFIEIDEEIEEISLSNLNIIV